MFGDLKPYADGLIGFQKQGSMVLVYIYQPDPGSNHLPSILGRPKLTPYPYLPQNSKSNNSLGLSWLSSWFDDMCCFYPQFDPDLMGLYHTSGTPQKIVPKSDQRWNTGVRGLRGEPWHPTAATISDNTWCKGGGDLSAHVGWIVVTFQNGDPPEIKRN